MWAAWRERPVRRDRSAMGPQSIHPSLGHATIAPPNGAVKWFTALLNASMTRDSGISVRGLPFFGANRKTRGSKGGIRGRSARSHAAQPWQQTLAARLAPRSTRVAAHLAKRRHAPLTRLFRA